MATDAETLRIVRALKGVATALSDEADAAIARQRIAEMEANPERVLQGAALEKKMQEWLS